MIKKIVKNDWFLPAAVFGLLVAIALGIVLYKQAQVNSVVDRQTTTEFIYECDPSNPSSIECYQKKYVDSVRQIGMVQTFDQLRTDYQSDGAIQANCHQITHAIGREAVAQFKTIEAAYDRGDNFCWSGFYHGVMEAVAKDMGKEEINQQLTQICSNVATTRQYSFYHYNCVHGMGHGLMGVNEDNLFAVLELCDKFTDTWEQRSCYGGAFMENIMLAVQMGGQSDYLKDEEPMYPCTAVNERYKQECYLMQTSQALRVLGYDYDRVFNLCAEAGDYRQVCYQSLGRDASGNSTSNVEKTAATCAIGKTLEARQNCIVGAVKDFISYHHNDDQAKVLCDTVEEGISQLCHATREEYVKTL